MIEKLEQLVKDYTATQMEDCKEPMVYLVSEIKHLIAESYKDGFQAYHYGLRKQIMREFEISDGQGIAEAEYYKLGESIGYKLEII